MIVTRKWSHLQWLWRRDRSLILPALVFASIPYSGMYFAPLLCREEISGMDVDRRDGIICISTHFPDSHFAATLAHEWRHHWQWANGMEFDHTPWNPDAPDSEYDDQIRHFYRTSKTEMDALLFERKFAPSEVNDHHFGLVVT